MHILFLSDNFPPEVNAPATRTYEHCREWVKSGHQVTVVTCAPNFPQGRIYEGYRNRLWQSEWLDGIRVIRVWSYVTANEGILRRSLDYLSYMASATCAAPFVRRPDIVVGTSPQFFTACAAYLISRMKRIPFVFELRDLWPESIKAVGAMQEGWLLRVLEYLEAFLYRRAASVVTVTLAFKRILSERGIDPAKIDVVTNGVDLSRFSPRPKDAALEAELGLADTFVAGYIGTHGMAHGLSTLLEAAEKLKDASPGSHLRFLMLGDGAKKADLVDEAAKRGLDNVTFLDSVPRDQVSRYWSLLDACIIHLKNEPLFESVIPSKLFEAMAMGVPVLHGVSGESAELVSIEDIGLTFEPEDAAELCGCLIRLAEDTDLQARLGANCALAAAKYDRAARAEKMLSLLGRGVEGPGAT
jgi:glycosyltransferase involved in cell wall biosynthesis